MGTSLVSKVFDFWKGWEFGSCKFKHLVRVFFPFGKFDKERPPIENHVKISNG